MLILSISDNFPHENFIPHLKRHRYHQGVDADLVSDFPALLTFDRTDEPSIAITGLVVLGGHTRVKDPHANFRNAFEGSASPYGVTNSLVKIIFSYAGYENAFNLVNEIKVTTRYRYQQCNLKTNSCRTQSRQSKRTLPTLCLRSQSFICWPTLPISLPVSRSSLENELKLTFDIVPKHDIMKSGVTVASLFFTNVFGHAKGVKVFNLLIALSSFGNLIAVMIGQSRVIRECGRQGVLPFPKFWASTKPFGTPAGPYLVKWGVTMVMILAPPAGDAFNFSK